MSDISKPHRNGRLRAMLLLGLLGLLVLTGLLLAFLSPRGTGQRIGVGDTLTLAKDRRVLNATLRDEDALIVGDAKPGRGLLPQGGRFSAELPSNGKLTLPVTALLAATGAQVKVDHQDGKERARVLLTTLIPVLALTDLVWLVMLSPRNARTAGRSWPASRRTVGTEATGEVVVMSSNPVLTGTGPSSELVTTPVAKTQGRRASTGRHLRTRTSSRDEGAEEGDPPPKARKAAPRKAVPDPNAGTTGRGGPGRTKATGAGAAAGKATRAAGSAGRVGSAGASARKATPTGGAAGREGSTGRGSRASSAPTDATAATDAAFGSGDVQPSAPAKRARPAAKRTSAPPPSRRTAPDVSPSSRARRAAPDAAAPASRARRAGPDASPAPDTAVAPRKRSSRRTES